MFLKKLLPGQSFSELAHSSPITEELSDSIPSFHLPGRYTAEPAAQALVSPLDPEYIHRPVLVHGEPLQPHPLQPLADLAASAGAGYENVAGVLTATYPDMWRPDLGRKVCVRYPNGDAWFNVIGGRCAFGATVDGLGGGGDDEAWLAGHMTLAIALRLFREGIPQVSTTRAAAALLHRIIYQAHSELMQLDLKGSAAVVLHACFHVKDDQYVFVFAAMGDAEAYWYDSKRSEWRYLVEPIGPSAHTLRINSSQVPGAVGKSAADEKGHLRARFTNLQYGVVACRAADMFLIGSDGVWDTLDAVQNGTPRQFSLNHDSWAQLDEREVRRIVPLVPIFKQRRLNEITRGAVARGPQAVVDAVVDHTMKSTRGERELFEIVDIESEGRASIYADTPAAKGMRDSLYASAKRASEAAGELIFAKPDHVGVQAFRPAAIAPGKR